MQRFDTEIAQGGPPDPPVTTITVELALADWLRERIKPGAATIDTQTAEFRALFGTLVHRVEKVLAVKSEVARLK
jgi:hypothetical protein